MITNTTNCKEISKAIITGSDKVYAFKLNENNSMISALVKHPSISNLVEKQIDIEVIQQEYMEMINEIATKYRDTIDPKEWIFCKKNNSSTENQSSTEMANASTALVTYHYRRNNTIPFLRTKNVTIVTKVRVTLIVHGEYNHNYLQHCVIKAADFKFHVLLNNNNNTYDYISDEELCDMCHKKRVMQWKITSIEYFLNNWDIKKNNMKLCYPDDDLEDPDFNEKQPNRGHYGRPVYVYFPIKNGTNFVYESQLTQLQIAAVGYHKRLNKFYGLILHPDGRKSHEEVDEKWIRDNNWQQWYPTHDIIEFIKNNTDQSKMKFIRCGWGLPAKINYETDQLNKFYIYNQRIEYQQRGKPTCAFSSLASMLFLQGHIDESIYIANHGNNESKLKPGESNLILKQIAELFSFQKVFRSMRKQKFVVQRLTNTLLHDFNIFEWQFLENEFILGVLWGDDGFHFHVCCFSKNMIVDGNHQYALQLNQESLNIICQCDFKKLYNALYFHKRNCQPIAGAVHPKKRKCPPIAGSVLPTKRKK